MGGSWARSGAARSAGPRPAESWAAAVARARESWDALTGGPRVCSACWSVAGQGEGPGSDCPACGRTGTVRLYSEAAAAAILRTAGVLWGDTARALSD